MSVWEDDFQSGFDVGGGDARWRYWGYGEYLGDDGVVETGPSGLRVRSSGTNPVTGEPAFVRTLAQEGENGLGLPGALDRRRPASPGSTPPPTASWCARPGCRPRRTAPGAIPSAST